MNDPRERDASTKHRGAQKLYDDNGDAIGPRQYCIDEGLVTSQDDDVVQALALLSPAEIAEALANRVVIEQAKGIFMFVYRVTADEAHELLRWHAQTANVDIRRFAARVTADLVTGASLDEAGLRAACDAMLFNLHD